MQNLSGYNRAAGANGRRGLDGSKSSLLFSMSEIVRQLCAQPFFGEPCPIDTALPNDTTVTFVQRRQPFEGLVIDSVQRSRGDGAPPMWWYRIRFARQAGQDDLEMWCPSDAICLSTGAAAVKDSNRSDESSQADGPARCHGCAEASHGDVPTEEPRRCDGCQNQWHHSCMAAIAPAASTIWETEEAVGEPGSAVGKRWFCWQCLHPLPRADAKPAARTGQQAGAEASSSLESDDPDAIACDRCHRLDDAESMILCDSCDLGFHMFCLDPPLLAIPEGDWLCPRCTAEGLRLDQPAPAVAPRGGPQPLTEADEAAIELVVQQLCTGVQRASWRESLQVGDSIEALDVNRVWYAARVVGLRGGGIAETYHGQGGKNLVPHAIDAMSRALRKGNATRQILIHFKGWSEAWDEWVSVFSDRVQPSGTRDLSKSHQQHRPSVGDAEANRLAEVLRKQRGVLVPSYETGGLEFEARLLAEADWEAYRTEGAADAQVAAVVGALARRVEADHRQAEQRALQEKSAVGMQRPKGKRAIQRAEAAAKRLAAESAKREARVQREVGWVVIALVKRVAAESRKQQIAAARKVREAEQQRRRLRQQRLRQKQEVRAAVSALVVAVDKDVKQQAEVRRWLETLAHRVEQQAHARPTLALAVSMNSLQEDDGTPPLRAFSSRGRPSAFRPDRVCSDQCARCSGRTAARQQAARGTRRR